MRVIRIVRKVISRRDYIVDVDNNLYLCSEPAMSLYIRRSFRRIE